MPLTSIEARLISTLLKPGITYFIVADCRGSQVKWYSVFLRFWAKQGLLIRDLSPPPAELNETTGFYISGDGETPLVLGELSMQMTKITCDEKGLRNGDYRLTTSQEFQQPLNIIVQGINSIELQNDYLPLTFEVSLPANTNYSNIRIIGQSPSHKCPFPSNQTLYLKPDQIGRKITTECQLDIEPSVSPENDQWILYPRGNRLEVMVGEPLQTNQKRKLIVIFDQTCPDADRWADAHSFVLGSKQSSLQDHSVFGEGSDGTDGSSQILIDSNELNQSIRTGLATALIENLNNIYDHVDLYCFSDSTDGLGVPKFVDMPSEPFRVRTSCTFENLNSVLNNYPYLPGLDLWDALDLALAAALKSIDNPHQTSVLIVGNSPPHFPDSDDQTITNAFFKILNFPKARTTFRRKGDFVDTLRKLEIQGVPVCYLFLEGHQIGGEQFSIHSRYSNVQQLVIKALEQCGIVIHQCDASEGEIKKALPKALKKLHSTSWVSVRKKG